jgi:glycolate oxidase FAD binding subunit
VSTRAIGGVVRHEPGDGTLTARAGATMAELAARAASGGHWLTPDVARPDRCTLAGVLAAGESGADRLRFGPARHHVLGMRVALADGTLAKSGGQLVKNVTGYDLHRLYTGSHGSLCVILEASLRLFPLPESELWVSTRAADSAGMLERARAALALPARIVSLTAERRERASAWTLFARLAGKRDPVDAERAELLRAWPDAEVVAGGAASEAARALRDSAYGATPDLRLHVACRPGKLAAVLDALEAATGAAGLSPKWRVEPGIAYVDSILRSDPATRFPIAPLVLELRRTLRPLAAQLALRDAPGDSLGDLDPLGDAPRGLELAQRIRHKLDPEGRFVR